MRRRLDTVYQRIREKIKSFGPSPFRRPSSSGRSSQVALGLTPPPPYIYSLPTRAQIMGWRGTCCVSSVIGSTHGSREELSMMLKSFTRETMSLLERIPITCSCSDSHQHTVVCKINLRRRGCASSRIRYRPSAVADRYNIRKGANESPR